MEWPQLEKCPECSTESLATADEGHTFCFECGYMPPGDELLLADEAASPPG